MTESLTVEVWEYQRFYRQTWIIDEDHSWTYKNFEKCYAPEEITLPSTEWCWATNWRIDCKPGLTDAEGWEYAGKFIRFKVENRKAKSEKSWNSKCRRRMWSRIMRREAIATLRSNDLNKALPRIQSGLSSIHQARVQIEDIVKKVPDAIQSTDMQPLVEAVRKNIADILAALDQCEQQQPMNGSQAVIKKLRNDVIKEQSAIEKVLNPNFIDRSKVVNKRAAVTGKQSFSVRDTTPRPSESFSRMSEMSQPPLNYIKSGSISESNLSSKNPFDVGYESEVVVATPASVSPNFTPNPSFSSSNDAGTRNNGIISSHDTAIPKHAAVKGGTAGAFDPSVLKPKSKASPWDAGMNENWETPKDGVFLDRTMQEQMIEQKLRPVDEATVMQSIIDERAVEIKKIYKGIVQVQDMFVDLSRIVKEQQIEIDKIFDNVEESHAKTQDAFKNIVQAEQLQRSSNCIIS